MQWQKPVISATQGSTNRSMVVQASLGIKQDPISNITKAQRAGGVVQMVENLLSQPEFNPQYCQKDFKNKIFLVLHVTNHFHVL
jgi:hypothetical protein